jgi:geranylgeranyl diphosphate synthase type II
MTDYKQKYSELQELIENQIANSFLNTEQPDNLYIPIRYFLEAKGKRFRPVLTLIATGVVGGDITKALKAAVSLEFLHNFTLIHDDIMDKSPIRRGRPTVHTKWDESVAILSGDILLGIAFRTIIEDVQSDYCKEVLLTFTDALVEVCEGQGFDIDFENRTSVSFEQYLLMIKKKTAKLIEKAMLVGGYIGNANPNQLEALKIIGQSLGIGFQLQDDLLDLTASADTFGKEIGKDIREGKKTFLILQSKELFNDDLSINLLNKFFANKGLQDEEVSELINYMESYGVMTKTKEQINYYFKEAITNLEKLPNNEYKDLLRYVIEKILQREY